MVPAESIVTRSDAQGIFLVDRDGRHALGAGQQLHKELENGTLELIDRLGGRVGLQLDIYHLQRTHGELLPTIAATAAIHERIPVPVPKAAFQASFSRRHSVR